MIIQTGLAFIFRNAVRRLGTNLVWGLEMGLGMAGIFCLIGVALRLVRGPHFLDSYGITFQRLMSIYVRGGIGAGLLAGLGRPLGRWRAGAIAVGICGGFFVYTMAGLSLFGPIAAWNGADRFAITFLGLVVGGATGNRVWEKYVYPTLPPPEPPPGPPPPRSPLGQWRPR